eukprot:1814448-Amphidinium_carterae.1
MVHALARCLDLCERLFLALETLEKEMPNKDALQIFHGTLIFAKQQWCREVLVGLAECRWQGLPKDHAKGLKTEGGGAQDWLKSPQTATQGCGEEGTEVGSSLWVGLFSWRAKDWTSPSADAWLDEFSRQQLLFLGFRR